MIVKVCGIRTLQNLSYLSQSNADWVGFIFYDKSKRNVHEGDASIEDIKKLDKKKVGVFVNESLDTVLKTVSKYSLDMVQLHGDEEPRYCAELKEAGVKVMKAFSVQDELPAHIEGYLEDIDYVLFDTKGTERGGNGVQFDWSVLESYNLDIPFLVSGGIGANDAQKLREIKNERMTGVDINSRFEIEPGLKNEVLLERFIQEFKSES